MSGASASGNREIVAKELDLYREMLRIRLLEEEIAKRYSDQKMRCPVHLSIGQEAIPVGVSSVLSKRDQVVSTHRCHAHYMAKGGNLGAMLAEIYGRADGCCGGRGGSMHLFDPDAGVLTSLPIVASAIPVGVGAALAFQQRGEDTVCVVYFGDGAVEEGVFHESANFAALMNLPVIMVCENNEFSIYTGLEERQPDRPLEALGAAHGMNTLRVDGNDVLAVRDATAGAVERARKGEGPSLMICDTYRMLQHCGPENDDHLGYRSQADLDSWRARCPLDLLRARLATQDLAEGWDAALRRGIMQEVGAAFDFAEASPYPNPGNESHLVYA